MSCITVSIVYHPLLSSWNHTTRYMGGIQSALKTPVGGDIFCQIMRLSNGKWLFYHPEISAGEWRSDQLAYWYWSNPCWCITAIILFVYDSIDQGWSSLCVIWYFWTFLKYVWSFTELPVYLNHHKHGSLSVFSQPLYAVRGTSTPAAAVGNSTTRSNNNTPDCLCSPE